MTGNGFDASEDGTGRGTPLVPDRAGVPSVTGAVTAKWAKGTGGPSGDEAQNLVTDSPAVLMTMREGKPGGGKGPLMVEEESLTLATGNGQTLFQPEPYGFSAGNSAHARSMGEEQGVAPPIRAGASGTNQSPTVGPVAYRKSRRPQSATDDETWVEDGQANTLNVFDVGDTRTTHAIVEPQDVESLTPWPEMGEAMRVYGDSGPSPSLKMHSPNVMATYGVRRLTPVECERLQAFPDGWTEPAGSDSARYKALGNAVTVNTVGWILRRMVEA